MKTRIVAAVLAMLAASSAFAQAKPEDAIRLRQGGFQLMARNMGMLGAMAKGDVAFNKETLAEKSFYINELAKDITSAGFIAGSDKGLPTKAKANIWSDAAGFKAAGDKLTAATYKLANAGDLAALRTAMGELQGSCKNCHDNYRGSAYQ